MNWLSSYIQSKKKKKKKKKKVVFSGVQSEYADLLAGVPQGSVLGTLLLYSILTKKKLVFIPLFNHSVVKYNASLNSRRRKCNLFFRIVIFCLIHRFSDPFPPKVNDILGHNLRNASARQTVVSQRSLYNHSVLPIGHTRLEKNYLRKTNTCPLLMHLSVACLLLLYTIK